MKKTVSALALALLAMCAATPLCAKTVHSKASHRAAAKSESSTPYLQCVTFARQLTGMQIFGDAWTWWEHATGKYDEGHAPKPGAVLVFKSQGRMRLGHVAVVSQIITDRYIQVTHANWSPINGRRGQVEDHVNVLDVSDKGDWSKVKVWYGPLNDLGNTVYDTYGFIYNDAGQTQRANAPAASPQVSPMTAAATQVAANDTPADLPADLKAALTPGNTGAAVRPVTVAAHVKGKAAAQLVAKIDSDDEDAADAEPVSKVKVGKKAVSHKTSAKKSAHKKHRR